MKPYGNEGMYHEDNRDSTKTGAKPGNRKTTSRRIARKARRQGDKNDTRKEANEL